MGEYEHYRRLWEEERSVATRSRPHGSTAHHVSAKLLRSELKKLSAITKDDAFSKAISAIDRHNLTDENGNWRRRPGPMADLYSETSIGQSIDNIKNRGRSLRAVCAMLAWDLDVESASFEAAVALLERIWREWKTLNASDP